MCTDHLRGGADFPEQRQCLVTQQFQRLLRPEGDDVHRGCVRGHDRAGQVDDEQPCCLHAGMDVYSWATGMEAGAPGELVVAALHAAFTAREIDMRSSPYDLRGWGLEPIPVETVAGRAEFVAFQRRWLLRTNTLRRRLLDALDRVDRWASARPAGTQTAVAPQVRTATSVMSRARSL